MQGTVYLNSVGSDIIGKIAFFFPCKKMILKCSFIGSMKKIAPLLSSPPRAVIAVEPKGKASLVYSCMQMRLIGSIPCKMSH